jgi:vacuolar-type H+-ATPase subunit I/STV1
VKLRRKEKSIIADKTKMFDLFTRMLNRSQKAEDFELTKYAQEAADFWTLMMLEEHHNDQICINRMYDMQDACQTWLDELLLILEGRVHADAPEEIETLIAKLSTLEKQLKEMHEEDSEKSERMAVDKDQIQQLKARVAVIDRELEVAALVSELDVICSRICDYL